MRKELSTVQRNIARLIEKSGRSVNAWAVSRGLTQTTVNRIVRGELDPTCSLLEKIALAADLQAWQLLVPEFDPSALPRLLILSADEQAMLTAFRAQMGRAANNTDFGTLNDSPAPLGKTPRRKTMRFRLNLGG